MGERAAARPLWIFRLAGELPSPAPLEAAVSLPPASRGGPAALIRNKKGRITPCAEPA